MVKRQPITIYFTPNQIKDLKCVSKESGEDVSPYVRRQILMIMKEEETQK